MLLHNVLNNKDALQCPVHIILGFAQSQIQTSINFFILIPKHIQAYHTPNLSMYHLYPHLNTFLKSTPRLYHNPSKPTKSLMNKTNILGQLIWLDLQGS